MANEQKKTAQEFAKYWEGRGYEKGESQSYWNMLLRTVLGVENPESFIEYEDQVMMDKSTGFIDGYIPSSKVLIEQKSIDKDLRKAVRQSDGSLLTPFQQAKKYIVDLPVDKHPRWVITCNFKEMNIYDMNKPSGEPEVIFLKDLPKEYYRLSFITSSENVHLKKEMELSLKAGDIVGKLYDAFSKQYHNLETDEHEQKSLNQLIVRIVFCLYAEDADLFKHKNQFHDYLAKFSADSIRDELIKLFKILDQKEEERDQYASQDLLDFPYVNGGLFSNENIIIPQITEEIKQLLLAKASDDFNWADISPTIFGAVFESTLNPETRRSGGMHYTSLENIHKVIDPLFLDTLRRELDEIKELKQHSTIEKKVIEYQGKLASLTFLDPAAGSGNFLTETYISLRKLENEALRFGFGSQMSLINPIKVSISQFYGIEINDFAVSVAQTALWIAESQMMKETEDLFNIDLEYLPLKSFSNYHEGNALTMDWNDVIPASKLNYIMGNPPFVGTKMMDKSQKEDTKIVLGKYKNYGTLDYVACWFKKAADFMIGTKIQAAFVSTNSISQGEQVINLWKPLMEENNLEIIFAYRTFRWDSEANLKAHVHCVIIGFMTTHYFGEKVLFENNRSKTVTQINPYLIEAPNLFIENRNKPICNASFMHNGCKFLDDGNYVFTEEEMQVFINKDPASKMFFRPYYGARNFINNEKLFCLWLKGANPKDIQNSPLTLERVNNVRTFRLNCKSPDTQKYADRPTLPTRLAYYSNDEDSDMLIVPITSSERRRYIPIGFASKDCIISYANMLIPDASFYTFGVLTSNVHTAWARTVCGRLKSDYRYSNTLVYNNFIWPNVSEEQKNKIEETGKNILLARQKYPKSSLSDMYGEEMYLYPELLKAHQENDKAVMEAYGFDWKTMSESECVAELMKLYQEMTEK